MNKKMYTVRCEGYTLEGENLRELVMILAHWLRRDAAKLYKCSLGEILFSECLKWAWEAGKQASVIDNYKTPNEILVILKDARKANGNNFTEWERNFLDSFTVRRKNFSFRQENTLIKMFLQRPQLRNAA